MFGLSLTSTVRALEKRVRSLETQVAAKQDLLDITDPYARSAMAARAANEEARRLFREMREFHNRRLLK